ncbi:ammonium transporter [Ahrensia sp. R2A130]|uniref:ammonium transporter n=1 Tax=Ahrensia sp. R2A130 TaxID=744979 RepID=UPI0001E0A4EF|nr:ammonium transporter [Ahrensia sp. R2A130]EFL88252.1 probable ammonium transporter, marine subtype [Ahrensia sp. R2A130]
MKLDLKSVGLVVATLTTMTAFPAFAQDAAAPAGVSPEVAYIFNTFLFLIGGFLVMFMAAGFAMLEAGLVRSKNVSMQCLKNIGLYSIAGLMYWVVGYSLMYTGVDGGYIGSFLPYSWDVVGAGDDAAKAALLGTGYSTASDWFFQMVFVATAASIVSGTVAERIKIWPFLIFVVFLTGFIYPIAGSWKWGAGWLDAMGFQDFAGSTLVHSVGGWAALVGALILGARKGKYTADGRVVPMVGSNIPLATLGTFILWLGWFGFNGASQLAAGSIGDISDVSRIFANTNLAAAGGVVATLVLMQIFYGKLDVTIALNGALAGLVAITAEPLAPSPLMAILIGAVGGAIVVFAVPMLDKLKIDDVVGAIPVHLFAGIWGTLAVPLTNGDASFGVQIIGIAAYAAFTIVASAIVWFALKATIGIRVSEEEEVMGLDKAEIGVEAYPEFTYGRG